VSGLSSGVQAIDAGESHTCALTTAGAVRCWGYNYYGQLGDGTTTNRWTPIAVSDLSSGVVAIAAGDAQTCALTVAGAVKCWGANYSGQLGDGTTINRYTPETVSGLSSGVQSIATGRQHTCALTTVGAMQCWGYNDYGQLGDGTNTTRYTPVAVSGLSSGVVAIAAGLYHTCAVTTVGAAQCWGYNTSGQLGDGTGTNRYTPTYALLNGQSFSVAAPALGVIGVSFPVTATSSSGLPVVITATGGCSLSGNDVTLTSVTPFCTVTYSQAGDAFYLPATQFSITSVDTDGDGTANATDTDDDNDGVLDYKDAMPLDASDWLDADYDGIGNSLDNDDDNDSVLDGSDNCPVRANPAQADSNSNGTGDVCEQPTIASGFFHTCAVTTAGALQCWGSNAYGQLGDGTTTSRTTPVTVSGLSSGAVAIAAGEYHTCALTVAGAVKCWGANTSGQLGDGTTVNRYTPVTVSGLSSGVVAVVAGRSHTCALTTAGAVWCWGKNYDGQLGDGTFTYRNTPVAVSGLSSGVAAIAAGDGHTCALTTAGAVLCWGRNVSGQLGDGTTMGRLTPVAVSGLNSAVVAIATGSSHSCALTTTGAVRCWGYNYYGQLGDGTTMGRLTPVAVSGLSNTVEAIATGSSHNCALTTAGAVRCWGYNYYGQLGDGTTMDRLTLVAVSGLSNTVAAIATGYAHSCALTTAGALRCWGRNFEGQLGDGTTTQRHTPVFVLRDGDGDGVLDAVDAFPYDVGETLDTDNDGIGNNADHDDDGDGTPDVIDLSPLNSAVSENDLPLNGNYKGSTIRDKVQVK
jgi:alpha-tubulin suppressor-like RCC1 family protein